MRNQTTTGELLDEITKKKNHRRTLKLATMGSVIIRSVDNFINLKLGRHGSHLLTNRSCAWNPYEFLEINTLIFSTRTITLITSFLPQTLCDFGDDNRRAYFMKDEGNENNVSTSIPSFKGQNTALSTKEETDINWIHWIQRHPNRGFNSIQPAMSGPKPLPARATIEKMDIGKPRLSCVFSDGSSIN